ncbi:MAG TPA: HEAT repeat domain-containing protein [Blastocatellia bacterium]|nr:HEAT repeat domain-containing protein [Blastocatellia bacterium]
MRKQAAFALLIAMIVLITPRGVAGQQQRFQNVDGPNLRAKIDAAQRQARSASQQKFWTAYAFDVRPGVAVDYYGEGRTFRGHTTNDSGVSISIGETDGVRIETRNVGVFLLHDAASAGISRIEVYNLDRPREYSGYPVYWLGRASNQESLELLRGLTQSGQANRNAERATMAIGLHDDPRVGGLLKELVQNSQVEKVRTSAVFWLGQFGDESPYLADLARNEQESIELRKQAVFALGISKDTSAFQHLQSIYRDSTNREVKKQIIFAASISQAKNEPVDFLIKVAGSDSDREVRKQALFWLGQKAGQRSLDALSDAVSADDGDTEVQKQAVFAISQRPRDEAVPLLIKIARNHPKKEVRKQAMFWLGQTGDERALEFFKEILAK